MSAPSRGRRPLRVALLQFRTHPSARLHEEICFRRAGALAVEEVEVHDLTSVVPAWSQVGTADVVVLGGAGEESVTDGSAFLDPLRDVVCRLIDEDRPVYGSCFGHHLLAELTGGRVILDPAAEEVGSFDVYLSAAGRSDPLFLGMPRRFATQLGHHDRVVSLGPGVVELAYSQRCRNQAIRVEGKPVYGTQFHPEMTDVDMRRRVLMYQEEYLSEPGSIDDFLQGLRPSPECSGLFQRFLELYV